MNKPYKKKRPVLALPLLCLALGIAVLSYPHISQYQYAKKATVLNAGYLARMEEYPESGLDQLYKAIVEYNESLHETLQNGLVDAFSYEQVDFSLMQFGFEEEMIGYIKVPKIDIELPIYLGANRANLDRGAAHLTQTSLPVGGENTNAVLAAHRGMGTAAMFRDIAELEPGDDVFIVNFRETLRYKVVDIQIIDPQNIQSILIQPGKDMVTLITCHPYRYDTQRYVVYCERVEG